MKTQLTLLASLFILLAATSCQEDNSPTTPTLTVSPSTAISFTAEATETFEIIVTTNQSSWDVSSSQAWCQVSKSGDKFTVTATANTLVSTPSPAVLTVTAGEAQPVKIDVTQAAGIDTYPASKESLVNALSKTWVFPEASDYISLEFDKESNYTLFSKKPLSRAEETPSFYVTTGTYTVGDDLHIITLTSFGKVEIKNLTNTESEIKITPNGESTIEVKVAQQTIAPATPSVAKKIKKIWWTEDGDDVEYSLNYEGDKLSALTAKIGTLSIISTIRYETDKAIISANIPQGAFNDDFYGDAVATYSLSGGLATTYQLTLNGKKTITATYKYDASRQMTASMIYNTNGTLHAQYTAQWVNGNIARVYTKEEHQCNGDYGLVGGEKIYHHDHNNDGLFDQRDVITFENHIARFTYTTEFNKAGFVSPNIIPRLYTMEDFFGFVAYCANIFGKSTANLQTCYDRGSEPEEQFAYQFDPEGYPTSLNITDSREPGNFVINYSFE